MSGRQGRRRRPVGPWRKVTGSRSATKWAESGRMVCHDVWVLTLDCGHTEERPVAGSRVDERSIPIPPARVRCEDCGEM